MAMDDNSKETQDLVHRARTVILARYKVSHTALKRQDLEQLNWYLWVAARKIRVFLDKVIRPLEEIRHEHGQK